MSAALFSGIVTLLIDQLGNPSWHVREKSQRALTALAPVAVAHLEKAGRHPDAEVRCRAGRIYEPYRVAKVERLALSLRSEWPWLHLGDGYGSYESGGWLELAQTQVERVGGPDWREYRKAAFLWARSQLLAARPVVEVQRQLDAMVQAEQVWRHTYLR